LTIPGAGSPTLHRTCFYVWRFFPWSSCAIGSGLFLRIPSPSLFNNIVVSLVKVCVCPSLPSLLHLPLLHLFTSRTLVLPLFLPFSFSYGSYFVRHSGPSLSARCQGVRLSIPPDIWLAFPSLPVVNRSIPFLPASCVSPEALRAIGFGFFPPKKKFFATGFELISWLLRRF